jgi:hypothetical protein
LISKGKIPSFKIGSEWRFRKDVIMRWFDEKSMRAQLEKVIESDANGGVRRWPMTRFRGPER